MTGRVVVLHRLENRRENVPTVAFQGRIPQRRVLLFAGRDLNEQDLV